MLRDLAEIVRGVGGLLLEWRESRVFEGAWEGPQFKGKVDLMAHHALAEKLRKLSPEIPVVSEEDLGSLLEERPSRYWLIDPLDGTASFIQGYSGFVTQAALMVDHSSLLAAIYASVSDALYVAERGHGSYLNGKRLFLPKGNHQQTLIDNYPEPRGVTRAAFHALDFKRYLESGSISLKICHVATGTADLFFKDVVVRDWDVAAPQLVLEEAGGFVCDIQGRKINYTGSYEHLGIVAAPSEAAAMRLVTWHKGYIENVEGID